MLESLGGELIFVRLTLDRTEQERRIDAPSRAEYGKLKSLDLLRTLTDQFDLAMAAMPAPALSIDTRRTFPADAAQQIAATFDLPRRATP